MSQSLFRVETGVHPRHDDAHGRRTAAEIREALGLPVADARVIKVYTLRGLDREQAESLINRAALHDHLAEAFSFPQWYGRNLDALWDLLGEVGQPTHIRLYGCQLLPPLPGDYGRRLLELLERATAQNPNLMLTRFYGPLAPKE